jgi:hypothetical protein
MPECVCNNCPGRIEFEETSAGQTATCPHCGLETVLYGSQSNAADEVPPLPASPVSVPPRQSSNKAVFWCGAIAIVFLALLYAVPLARDKHELIIEDFAAPLRPVQRAYGWNLGDTLPAGLAVETNDNIWGMTHEFGEPYSQSETGWGLLILTEDRRIAAIRLHMLEKGQFSATRQVLEEKYGLRQTQRNSSYSSYRCYFGPTNRQAVLEASGTIDSLQFRDEGLCRIADKEQSDREVAAEATAQKKLKERLKKQF